LIEAQSYTKNKIVANQVHYNLIYREPEQNLLEYCQKNDVLLVAWRPLEL
jgi:diketogulonate reductase-like aldo/keto reductase